MSNELHDQALGKILLASLSPGRVGKLVEFFDEVTGPDKADSLNAIFKGADHRDLMIESLEDFSDEQIKDLFRPLLPAALAEALGAKNVTIDW